LKLFHNAWRKPALTLGAAAASILAAGWLASASGSLPSWIRNVEPRTEIEAAFFRRMSLLGGDVLFRRPPRETRPALSDLIQKQPKDAQLYSLRALEDEQQLDFVAAEADWKLYVANSSDKATAQLALADFYHRRLLPLEEIKALTEIAVAPADPSEKFTSTVEQRSWHAFERIFETIHSQGLSKEQSIAEYQSWIARYPQEASLYGRFLEYLIVQKEYDAATGLVAEYHRQFPGDNVFAVKATALVEYRRGSLQQGLAIYEKSFQPLWDPELVKSYFDLLAQTERLRKFLDGARSALNTNPLDLNATARVFYYYQQQGKLDAAQQAITAFRLHKEAAKSAFTSQELYVCARLLEDIHSYPEAARFYFALYNSSDLPDAREKGLSGIARLLLTAPEAPIRLGTGELSQYRDIATMDAGPGYLNGILSLILNTTSPASEFSEEEQRAVSYFHRSKAAELLALLDAKFPNASSRPELHEMLLEYCASVGESDAVIKGGAEYLAAFPKASGRTSVALLMADSYSRLNKTREEFAIYDSILQELSAEAEKMPLGARVSGNYESGSLRNRAFTLPSGQETEQGEDGQDSVSEANTPAQRPAPNAAFQVKARTNTVQSEVRSPEYSRILERYLARLVELKKTPEALGVLRREIDHNPDDPGLYERLAVFLEQNQLGTEQEDIYRRAMARFPDRNWYHKLARYYLRHEKNAEFEKLTKDAVKSFEGSELETYFHSVVGGTPELYLRLNLYANARFPHNPVFVRNLLNAYRARQTYDEAAWEALLRQHWFEESFLRDVFFEFLSATGKLETELRSLQQSLPTSDKETSDAFVHDNPAAGQFVVQAELWRSHYEASAPFLKSLANEYPAEVELGHTASSVFRSLAYLDATNTDVAVKIESNLLAANPGSTQTLARIGDIYADRELFSQAAPYWEKISAVLPGESGGYLEASTIYWDYYDFDNALRMLSEGRQKLGDESLYGYEAGAIYENKREYPRAIQEYAKAALASGPESPATNRLMDLARRPKLRELVDLETKKLAETHGDSTAAVNLRVRVLEVQNRKPELISFLDSVVSSSTTIEQAAEIETLAQQKSLETVRQHALEKQAALATDPVTKLELRYALVHLYESRKDFVSAQRNIETLYKENPKILGVVRSTVDFYWKQKLYAEAIVILRQAAKDSYPDLSIQFTFEAARKSTEARKFEDAREILARLLKDSPYDSQYLAAMADTYGQAGDQQGLKQFYLEKIGLFRNAPLTADERKAKLSTLRRGLIPALTLLKDNKGAVDQYIELINAYPEDENLVTEAALYALRYKRQRQLLDFYIKTIQQSPRDYRWSMALARIYTNFEDFPAAIDAYGKSIAIRPDRSDLRVARAELAERLMHFDDAIADYERIYQLTFKDPKWMEKVAEIRARQGRTDDAVAALKIALIDIGPERAKGDFEVARRLESWEMLEQARNFAEQGVNLAGGELLASTEFHDGAKLYTRIMARLRQQEKAYPVLQAALTAASSPIPVLKEQVAKEGIAAVTDKEWRERTQQMRIQNARNGMKSSLEEMGATVTRYFTPEEKTIFVKFAQSLRAPMNPADTDDFALPLVRSAGLAELEAHWRYDLMTNAQLDLPKLRAESASYIELQRHRLKFTELGQNLEKFNARIPRNERIPILLSAAEAYRSAGDTDNELRVLSEVSTAYKGGTGQKRFLELLLQKRPQDLVGLASSWTPWGEQVANFVVANGDESLTQAVVSARGKARPTVWTKSYSALAGLYFADSKPEINAAFLSALGDQTIGDRLGKKIQRDSQLAGDIWFYYGSRYGEYLGATKQGTPEDFLPSALEQSPASVNGYLTLADYYEEMGDTRAAIADYNHTLELAPGRAEIHDRLAGAYFKQGSRAEAVTQWKLFFGSLARQIDKSHVPESFWSDFERGCEHVRSRHLFSAVKPDVDTLLRAYLRGNGTYRSNAILKSAFLAAGDPAQAGAWIVDLSSAASDPIAVLSDIADVPWIPLPQRGAIYQRILDAKQNAVAKSDGLEKEGALQELHSWQVRWMTYLIQTKQFAQAIDFLGGLPRETKSGNAQALVPLELLATAQLKTLDAKLEEFRANPEAAPSAENLRASARQLFDAGDKLSARKILEFIFAGEIEQHELVAANFLGLAEIRIAAGDMPGALELLRRLVLVVGTPYENLDSAAGLLEKTGHHAEAVEFLDQLVKSAPWEPAFRYRLAKAQIASSKNVTAAGDALSKLASSLAIPHSLRVDAALAGVHTNVDFGSTELNILAGAPRSISATSADTPFFYDARLRAATGVADTQSKLRLLSAALADTPMRDDARIPLFQTAAGLHNDEFALASVEQILQGQGFRQVAELVNRSEDEIISSAENDSDAPDEQASPQVHASTSLSQHQQIEVARAVGHVMIRLNRFAEALPYLQFAQKLEKTAARRKETTEEIVKVRSRLRGDQANAARQPILHAELEQSRLVRPRLVAHAESAAAPIAKNGEMP
jgi:predicted Zn-dependent protease